MVDVKQERQQFDKGFLMHQKAVLKPIQTILIEGMEAPLNVPQLQRVYFNVSIVGGPARVAVGMGSRRAEVRRIAIVVVRSRHRRSSYGRLEGQHFSFICGFGFIQGAGRARDQGGRRIALAPAGQPVC